MATDTSTDKKKMGRPKGSPNRLTTDVRQLVLGALEDVGGRRYLKAQAAANPKAFMALVAKCMPTMITGANDGPLEFTQITRTIVRPSEPK